MAMAALSLAVTAVVFLCLVTTGHLASVANVSAPNLGQGNHSPHSVANNKDNPGANDDVDVVPDKGSQTVLLKTHFSIGEAKSLNLTAVASHDGKCPLYFAMDPTGACRPIFTAEEATENSKGGSHRLTCFF
jgi:hypothetical protein